jgi:hypothetical protein
MTTHRIATMRLVLTSIVLCLCALSCGIVREHRHQADVPDGGTAVMPEPQPEPPEDCLDGDASIFRDSFVAHTQAELEALAGIRHITGNLGIQALFEDVPNLQPLRCLEDVDGTLDVTATMLTSLRGLEQLAHAGAITLAFNANLQSLAGLDHLARVDGTMNVDTNIDFRTMSGLPSLQEVGSLVVHNNPALTSLVAWPATVNIRDSLELEANVTLQKLPIFSGFKKLERLVLRGNAEVDSLRAFRSLESVTGTLVIANQSKLENLSGLVYLVSAGSLVIDFNESLTSLSGIERLTHVDGDLSLTGNVRLSDLSGLSRLRGVGGQLRVYSNTALRSCDAEALALRLGVVCSADPPIECRSRCTCTGSIDPSACGLL